MSPSALERPNQAPGSAQAHGWTASNSLSSGEEYDVAIIGASLAGCASAIFMARAGARVVLVDRSPDPAGFKRICSHLIQSSAIPTLGRLGLLAEMHALGAQRTRGRVWTRWGWILPCASSVPSSINLRRERLDPLLRATAAQTPGVELALGYEASELIRAEAAIAGVSIKDRHGERRGLAAKLVVGADGRDSHIAGLAGVPTRSTAHGRFAYGGYFEGAAPRGAPDSLVWMLDPDWAAVFPTDGGLSFYAAMPTKAHLPEFRSDPAGALARFLAGVPDPPPIQEGSLVGSVLGKLEMPNIERACTAPGLALVGDAALAVDPLWGVGCGWALQSAEWLADSVGPALGGAEPLSAGLRRYRRRHTSELRGHARMMEGYSRGRRLNLGERILMSAAVRDGPLADSFEELGTRNVKPARFLAGAIPRAVIASARQTALRGQARRPASGKLSPR